MHRLQIRQWCEWGGLKLWHWLHMLSFDWLYRWASVGTALEGTDPGSVRVVLTWHASAKAATVLYIMDQCTGIPLVRAKSEMVRAEYKMSTHTMQLMMHPAKSDWLSQIPFSSLVPTLQDQLMSLKWSS
jgi:hypothetical protein